MCVYNYMYLLFILLSYQINIQHFFFLKCSTLAVMKLQHAKLGLVD